MDSAEEKKYDGKKKEKKKKPTECQLQFLV